MILLSCFHKFGHAAAVGGHRILRLGDGTAHHDVVGAQRLGLSGGGHTYLVAGLAAGIAHAAIAGHILGLPMGYVRSGSKDHGRQNQIEGRLEPGQRVVVIEDLISTGGSVISVVEALRDAGADVLGVVSIFTYGMQKSVDRLAAAGVQNTSLTDLDAVAQAGVEGGYITRSDVARLLAFRDNPSDESWINKGGID